VSKKVCKKIGMIYTLLRFGFSVIYYMGNIMEIRYKAYIAE